MLFNSAPFAVFFPVVTLAYFSLHGRPRQVWLLLASALFYAYLIPKYLAVLYALIVVDYSAGILIAGATGSRRRAYLGLSLAANLAGLSLFKYLGFASRTAESLSRALGLQLPLPMLELALPIGLSFHTFQSMAYTIEVYRGRVPAERDFIRYALYVSFYPQLVAGPIERPQGLLAQLHCRQAFRYVEAARGLRLMAVGLLKKIVVADRLAVLVNAVYATPTHYSGLPLLVATLFFSIQIYCDFSGYSDIARGAARVMGIELVSNFAGPYAATSLTDFWRRWHVSLSTWFRDYVYLPLGGGRARAARNVVVVFLLSGLWHGANWTFVVWGALHGIALLLERSLPGWVAARRFSRFRAVACFSLVSVLWVFFRASSLSDAWWIVTHLLAFDSGSASSLWALVASLAQPGFFKLHIPFAIAVFLFVFHAECRANGRSDDWVASLAPNWRLSIDYAIVLSLLLAGEFHATDFIYFQF